MIMDDAGSVRDREAKRSTRARAAAPPFAIPMQDREPVLRGPGQAANSREALAAAGGVI